MAMFENISEFFKRFMQNDRKELLAENTTSQSKETAKDRLHVVLMQDRANVSADFLELMKEEIIEVIKKYIVVDESKIDVRLTNEENEDGSIGAPLLHANIPILNIRNDLKGEYMHSNFQDKIEGQEELELDNNSVQIKENKTIQEDVENDGLILNFEQKGVLQESKVAEIEGIETKTLENESIVKSKINDEINKSEISKNNISDDENSKSEILKNNIIDNEISKSEILKNNIIDNEISKSEVIKNNIINDEINKNKIIKDVEPSNSQDIEIDLEDVIDELDDDIDDEDDDDVTFDDLLKAAEEEEEKLKRLEENKNIKENEEEKKANINKTTAKKNKTSKSSKKK